MNTQTLSTIHRSFAATTAALAALVLTSCATDTPTDTTTSSETVLSEDAQGACSDVFSRTVDDAEENILLINDLTASRTVTAMPDVLRDAIVAASLTDGTITVIAVDGEGVTPTIVAKNAALSTEGARDRPSVAELAGYMPDCVEQVLLPQTSAHAPGTDLHRAVSLGSELVTAGTTVYVASDFISTTGPFSFDEKLLALAPEDAASRITKAAPVDLQGAPTHVLGIGNTSTALLTANRIWLRDLASAVCVGWNGTGCENITIDPVNATTRDGLPDDPFPVFPAVAVTSAGNTCTLEVPASLAFGGDSDQLSDDADEVFAAAINLLLGNRDATASIIGHTASSNEYTADQLVDLGQRRADAVKALFAESGVDAARIDATGVGDTQPKVEDIDSATGLQIEEAAAMERRVDVIAEGAPCPA